MTVTTLLYSMIVFFGEYLGYVLLGVLLVAWLKNFKRYLPLFWQGLVAVILSRVVIAETIRFFWHRARPFVEQNFIPLIPHADTASFPSGHATFFFAIGTVLYLHNKKAGTLFLAGSALIGIARVFAGVHWPSDVIAGALIGVVSGWLVWKSAILYSRRNHAN